MQHYLSLLPGIAGIEPPIKPPSTTTALEVGVQVGSDDKQIREHRLGKQYSVIIVPAWLCRTNLGAIKLSAYPAVST